MTERETEHQEPGEETSICPVCGTSHGASDRFCAECGALLPVPVQLQAIPADGGSSAAFRTPEAGVSAPNASQSRGSTDQENAAWILGARPTAVMVGGLLLLLLAAALLAIGQREDTGTIVMLSICTAPLGLLVLVIGIARFVASAARRG